MNKLESNAGHTSAYSTPTFSAEFDPTVTVLRHRDSGVKPSVEEADIETALMRVILGYSSGVEDKVDVREYLVDPGKRLKGVHQYELDAVQELYSCGDYYLLVCSLWEGGLVTYRLKSVEGEFKLCDFGKGRYSPEDFGLEVGKEIRLNDVRARVRLAVSRDHEE